MGPPDLEYFLECTIVDPDRTFAPPRTLYEEEFLDEFVLEQGLVDDDEKLLEGPLRFEEDEELPIRCESRA